MLRVLIIEDEAPARERLIRMVGALSLPVRVVGQCASCADARNWLAREPAPHVILCDIRLGDGSALRIFEAVPPPCPIVFCTAYDRYVLEALEVGGVDYLLKPVEPARLEKALRKAEPRTSTEAELLVLRDLIGRLQNAPPRRRFLVRQGPAFVSVPMEDVAYFGSEHKLTVLVRWSGQRAYLDESLRALETELPEFFRANRSHLVSRDAVRSFRPFSRGRLALELSPPSPVEVLVSPKNKDRFRIWLSGSGL